jgi:MYXO-CTERM domain-containing protein
MATCMAFVTPKVAAGGACTQDYECTTGNCEGADTVSDPPVDGMCAGAISLAPIGAACANIECVDGAYCDSATSTCQASKGAGQTCTSDTECNNECDTATGTCTCYSGCNVAGPTPPRGVLLSLLVLGAVLVLRRSRRRRPNG